MSNKVHEEEVHTINATTNDIMMVIMTKHEFDRKLSVLPRGTKEH